MAETTDSPSSGGQHNHGPGIYIAGDVFGDVNNNPVASPGGGRDEGPQAPRERQNDKTDPLGGSQSDDEEEAVGPGMALLGYAWLTAVLFGMSGYCVTAVFIPAMPNGQRVGAVPVAAGSAVGGLVALACMLTALTELCAAGTANAAGSARARQAQGQWATARLNLRYAVSVARVAHSSAVLAGVVAGLVGFLSVGKRAADRAHDAREFAESEIVKTRSALRRGRDEG